MSCSGAKLIREHGAGVGFRRVLVLDNQGIGVGAVEASAELVSSPGPRPIELGPNGRHRVGELPRGRRPGDDKRFAIYPERKVPMAWDRG